MNFTMNDVRALCKNINYVAQNTYGGCIVVIDPGHLNAVYLLDFNGQFVDRIIGYRQVKVKLSNDIYDDLVRLARIVAKDCIKYYSKDKDFGYEYGVEFVEKYLGHAIG
jgi:hypothetical protein